MIEVSRREGGILVSGHAHYAESGMDIVCAGVSALAQTLIRSLEVLTGDAIEYRISPGTVDINFGNLSEPGRVLADSFFVGIGLIADEYPQCVRLV